MTKVEFIQMVQVWLPNSVSRETIGKVLDAAGTVGLKLIKDGRDVSLYGLGILKVKKRAARVGRNPKTGESLQIPARSAAKFTPSKALKDALKG